MPLPLLAALLYRYTKVIIDVIASSEPSSHGLALCRHRAEHRQRPLMSPGIAATGALKFWFDARRQSVIVARAS